MPSERQGPSYFQQVLRDSHTPFPYRNRVRLLLGLPEEQGPSVGQRYSQHSIPVAFHYRMQDDMTPLLNERQDSQSTAWLGSKPQIPQVASPSLDQNTSLIKEPAEATKNLNQLSLIQNHQTSPLSIHGHSSFPNEKKREPSNPQVTPGQMMNAGQIKQTERPPNRTASKDMKSPQVPQESIAAEEHDLPKQASHIGIPGKSSSRTSFPLLLNDGDSDSGKKAHQGARSPQQGTMPESLSDTVQGNSFSSRQSSRSKQSEQPFPLHKDQKTPAKAALASEVAYSPRHNEDQTTKMRSRSTKGSNIEIERLQKAVQELTARQRGPQHAEHDEPKPSAPAAPSRPTPKPVVMVQQTPRRFRTPDAFWERSHLGRMHIRLLR